MLNKYIKLNIYIGGGGGGGGGVKLPFPFCCSLYHFISYSYFFINFLISFSLKVDQRGWI